MKQNLRKLQERLVGNFDRHNGNWGFLINESSKIEITPIYDCASCLYPQLPNERIEQIINDKSEMESRVFVFPSSTLKINAKKINYFEYISSLQNEDCNQSLLKMFHKINMQKIYSAYPNTERIIGNLPQDWQNIIKNKKGEKEIIDAIDDFISTRDISKFKAELDKIFNQEVKVEKLNQGKYGVVYKISTLNSIDICLKIYHNKGKSKDSEIEKKRHGKLIEVQNLAFANQHSDNFVKMYLGRIGIENKNDAFILTQYLGKGVKIDKINLDREDDDYEFRALDNHSDNYKKCGKRKIIIDAGAIIIIKKSTGDIVSDF